MHRSKIDAATRHDLISALQAVGLRKSKVRLVMLQSLRTALPQHFTVDDLREALRGQGLKAPLSTVYNCLSDFTRAGLLRRLSVGNGEVYYDTRVDAHHHVFIEGRQELLDINASDVEILDDGTIRLPKDLLGHAADRIDLFVTIKT